MPRNDPSQLPTAFFVNRMKELHAKMEKAQGRVEAVCEMCSGAKAEAFCRQCTEFICNDCVRSHRKMKVFAGHKVVTLQELKEGGAREIPLKGTPPLLCKKHDEQSKIYCFDCSCLICRDCIVRDHAGHKFEFVKISAPQYKETLKECLTSLASVQTNILTASKEVENIEKEVSEQHKVVASTIQQSFNQLHEILRKREKQLLDQVSNLKQQKLDSLGAQRKGFALATSEIQGLMEFVERSIDNATDEEIMLLQKQIEERVREQQKKHECIDLVPAEVANIGVRVTCAKGISDLCQKNAAVMLLQVDPTKCTAEGPGVKVAEVGKTSQFTVRTAYPNGQLCKDRQIVEAELKSSVKDSIIHAKVVSKLGGVYEVTYTLRVRGRHRMIVEVNGAQIAGSPFQVFAKIHPTQLGKPVRILEGLSHPWGIALNSKQQLVVAEWSGKKVTVFDKDGMKIQTVMCEKFSSPIGVAVDNHENIYVMDHSRDSLFKFSKEGELKKVVERKGTQPGEFDTPRCIKMINDKLYICDSGNSRFQVLNTSLEYMNSFGCYGDGLGEFKCPNDIAQDGAGNLYVSDCNNDRVQVFDYKGQFLFSFGEKGASKRLSSPYGVCVDYDQFVYVCEFGKKCVSVFKTSGEFVTSFGQFTNPASIVIDDDGFVYVAQFVSQGKIDIF